MFYIYKITNNINGKCYIGRTKDINRRFSDHKRLAFTKSIHKEYEKALYRAFRKYGINNFTFEILEETEFPIEREIYWIDFFQSNLNGYNADAGGLGGSLPGHCSGERNGRAKLTTEDIVQIRTDYNNGVRRRDCYLKYQDRIGISGFADIWQGKSWINILPEVYTEANKDIHNKIEKNSAITRREFSTEEIQEIRQAKKDGMRKKIVFEKYAKGRVSINTFSDIWYEKSYKEIK